MEGTEGEGKTEFQTFIEVPAILDKYKAAAAVSDGKSIAPMHKSTFSLCGFYRINTNP